MFTEKKTPCRAEGISYNQSRWIHTQAHIQSMQPFLTMTGREEAVAVREPLGPTYKLEYHSGGNVPTGMNTRPAKGDYMHGVTTEGLSTDANIEWLR